MEKEQLLGIARHVLTIIGGALVAKGVIDESSAKELIGIGLSITALIWSVRSKK